MFFQCQGKDEYYSCPKKSTVLSFHGQHVPKHNCAFIFIAPRSMKCSPEDMCCGWEEGQKWAQRVHKVKRAGQGSRLKMGSHAAFHEVRTPSDSAIILLSYLHLVEETKNFAEEQPQPLERSGLSLLPCTRVSDMNSKEHVFLRVVSSKSF